jgi:hypothetical protein
MSDVIFWSSSSGRVELQLTMSEAHRGYHSGDCEGDIVDLMRDPFVRGQLESLDPEAVAATLRETGAWTETHLSDREANLMRLLWLACADLVDAPDLYQ